MAAIPNRAVFRSQEVCEIAEVQPYVLRSWEAEFPDLGLSKGGDAPRVYRKGDVERVLRLKHLLFVEGLTLAGARRQLSEEDPRAAVVESSEDTIPDADVAALLDREVRNNLRSVKSGLHWILGVLTGRPTDEGKPFRMVAARSASRAKKSAKVAKARKASRGTPSKPVRLKRPKKGKRAKGKRQR